MRHLSPIGADSKMATHHQLGQITRTYAQVSLAILLIPPPHPPTQENPIVTVWLFGGGGRGPTHVKDYRESNQQMQKWLHSSFHNVKNYKLSPFRDLDEKTLERKISLCREYLSVLDVIDAGISHNIGITAWWDFSI